jgi:hypothetical protein
MLIGRIAALAASLSLVGAGASAQPVVQASGACPSQADVAAALRVALPNAPIGNDAGAQVTDHGASFHVRVGPAERTFSDAARRCDERARKAAVFIALALSPPTLSEPEVREGDRPEDAAREPPVPAPAPVVTAAPREPRAVEMQLELGAIVDHAPGKGLLSGGAQARFYLAAGGGGAFGLVFGLTALSPTTVELGTARARLTRVPIDAGVRGVLRSGGLTAGLEGGPALAIQHTRGLDITPSAEETRVELSLRLAARLEYWAGPDLAPFIGLQAALVPRPSQLTLPEGPAGSLPRVWAALLGGLVLRVR